MSNGETEDLLKKYQASLGDNFGEVYFHARNEWCHLWVTWKQYKGLFGAGPERVDLMNRAGAGFFHYVQLHYFDAAILAICRLSDPVSTAGRQNLTVLLFENFVDTPEQQGRLRELLDDIGIASQFARDWRNRRIGHSDYALRTGAAEPLEHATLDSMDNAVDALHQVLAYISSEYLGTHFVGEVIDDHNNEMVMLRRLYLGEEMHQRELEALKNRDPEPRRRFPDWLSST